MVSTRLRWLSVVLFVAAAPGWAQAQRFQLPDPPYVYGPRFGPPLRDRNATELPKPPSADELRRDQALAALGRVLFYEPLLSRNGQRSCGSCHQQQHAFADPRRFSTGHTGRATERNSMSLVHLADLSPAPYQTRGVGFFWDGRAKTLEAAVLQPIQHPVEMGLPLELLPERLAMEPAYSALFLAAFGSDLVTAGRVGAALARFLRAIESRASRYDEGLAQVPHVVVDFPGFTAAENRGKQLFLGSASGAPGACASCHMGLLPAYCGHSASVDATCFQTFELRNTGLEQRDQRAGATPGVAGNPQRTDRFRAPSLRNVEVTGPYMHDGRFQTLEEVVRFYARGVRPHRNLDAMLQGGGAGWRSGWGGSSDSDRDPHAMAELGLPMNRQQQADLVAFLRTLTDRELLRDPRFADPFRSGR